MALGTEYPVVVPYIHDMLHPDTSTAVGDSAIFVQLGPTNDGYYWLLDTLWEEDETFVVVEHDVVPHAGALEELLACPSDWCAFPYDCGGLEMTGLGCTKFSAALTGRQPDVLSRIVPDQRGWNGLDAVVLGELRRRGEREHVHSPAVGHNHPEKET